MYVVNDQVNSHGGRFRGGDLLHLCMLIADTPVLIGHNRVGEPMARTFHAEVEKRGDVLWLKSYFYWPKTENDDFLAKIDSGVFKECSISFTFTYPECSACGQDIRNCPHEIELNSQGADKTYFLYRGITQVLETSLVYKGAVRGTHITDRLIEGGDTIIIRSAERQLSLSVPHGVTVDYVSLHLIGNPGKIYQVVAKPMGIMAAIAVKDNFPYLMTKLHSNGET
jgi:hypothetical protein